MSKLAVANIIFESTESNRIEYTGNNVVRVRANGGMQLPFGTTAQRVSPEYGLIRYNTDLGTVEMYDADGWYVMPTGGYVNNIYTTANAAYAAANTAGGADVTARTTANAAFESSNSANSYANATYVKLTSPNQTITGDLAITGNLSLLGNVTTLLSNNLIINDSLIYLAANNDLSDILDIGFVGHYSNGTANLHTGLFRDHNTKQYFLFSNLGGPEPETINDIVPYANGMINAVLNADIATSNLILGGANAINWITAAYGAANAKVSSVSGTSGRVTSSGGTTPAIDLATTAVTPASYGATTSIPVITVDAYGRVTYAANVSVQGGMDYVYANTIGASANAWANTKVSSVTGTSGQITSSGGTTPTIDLATAGAGAASYSSGISAITVDAYGRVTSVTGSASYLTDINSGQVTTALGFTPYNSTNPSGYITSSGSITGSAGTFTSTTQNSQFNSIGVGTAASATAGEIRATNNITAYYSDIRLKTSITLISNPIDKIKQLSGVSYKSNDVAAKYGYTDQSWQVGILAQEVKKVLPEAVKLAPFDTKYVDGVETSKSGENYMTVQYEKIIPLLIEAIKEQQKSIDDLNEKINELQKK